MIWPISSIVWCTLATGIFLLLKRRYAAIKDLEAPTDPLDPAPTLAVIIPARDEAENIADCLEGLIQQTYPATKLQAIVVDDGSSDDTAAIARTFIQGFNSLKLIEAGPLPHGWLGKPHACWVGAAAVQAEWLCFIDADTRHAPELLHAAMTTAQQENADLLSLHPHQDMLGIWERLLMPIPFMTLMLLMDAQRINDPASPAAMANGQFILIKRSVYDAIDGHRAIRDQVMDDIALARTVKTAGHTLKLFGGGRLIRTRMYKDIRSLAQGLARGASDIFGIPLASLAVPSSILAGFIPIAFPVWLCQLASQAGSARLAASAGLAVLGSLIWYGAHAMALRAYNVPLRYLLLVPLSNLLVAVVNLDGLLRRAKGQRLWKGRPI